MYSNAYSTLTRLTRTLFDNIYVTNNKLIMTITLTRQESNAIKELIYSKIDQIGGYELLDTNITNVLSKIIESQS